MALRSYARRHPLIWFAVLSILLSLWAWPLYSLGLIPVPVASFGPFLAALIVLGVTEGRSGVVGLLRRMGRWRVGAVDSGHRKIGLRTKVNVDHDRGRTQYHRKRERYDVSAGPTSFRSWVR
jgi:hypothetical protein